ncbi:MAG: hypothetical protein WBM08_13135 [Prochlorococcaceae cyanobacterium]
MEVWLYRFAEAWLWVQGPRDWDGCSDTDLLVVADTQEQADGVALSRGRWQTMASSTSPHWRRICREARPLFVREP